MDASIGYLNPIIVFMIITPHRQIELFHLVLLRALPARLGDKTRVSL
jgi:hypothetical protein